MSYFISLRSFSVTSLLFTIKIKAKIQRRKALNIWQINPRTKQPFLCSHLIKEKKSSLRLKSNNAELFFIENLHSVPSFRLIPYQKLALSLALDLITQCDSSSKACTPSSPPHNSSLWVHAKEKHHFEGAGMRRSSTLPVFFRNAHLSAQRVGRLKEPPPSSHSSDIQRQLHRKTSFLPAILPHRSSSSQHPLLSLSHTHSHTHTPRLSLAY